MISPTTTRINQVLQPEATPMEPLLNRCFQTRRADLGELHIMFDEFGHQHSKVILLIHGLAAQRIAWPTEFCTALADKGYRVIRFDNRDIGESSRFHHLGTPNILWMMIKQRIFLPLTSPYSLADMARDTVRLLDCLKIEKAHIVGASMGGMIAQRVAAFRPDRVLTLTSMMSSSGRRGLPGARKDVLAHLMSSPRSQQPNDIVEHELKFWQLIGSQRYPPEPNGLRAFVEESVKRGLPYLGGPERQLAAILADGSRVDLLKWINVPALVIHGDEDPLVPAQCGADTAAHIKNCEYRLVEGMGHDLPLPLQASLVEFITDHCRKNETDCHTTGGTM